MNAEVASRVNWAAVGLFVVLALGLAWIIAIPLWVIGADDPMFPMLLPVIGAVMMITPTIAAVATMLIMREPRTGTLRSLGIWPFRPVKRLVWWSVGVIVAVPLLVAASVGIAAMFGWLTLDLVGFSGYLETIWESLPAAAGSEAIKALPPVGMLIVVQLLMIPFGAVINAIPAAGEEIGWRGWLLPHLLPLGTWPALIVSGVIWGVWHSPLLLLGYNFGLTDWRGVALMAGACMLWGTLLGWMRLRTGSVWPAAFAHGALNAAGGLYLMLYAAGTQPIPALAAPLGAAGWIAVAATILVLVLMGQFAPQRWHQLAPARERRKREAGA